MYIHDTKRYQLAKVFPISVIMGIYLCAEQGATSEPAMFHEYVGPVPGKALCAGLLQGLKNANGNLWNILMRNRWASSTQAPVPAVRSMQVVHIKLLGPRIGKAA